MTYDPTKEYQTRDGREVMLLPERDWGGDLHGMYRGDDGDWRLSSWCGASLANLEPTNSPDLDLVEKPKTHVRWLTLVKYDSGTIICHPTTERKSDVFYSGTVLAIKRVEIAEGEGLQYV